MSRNQLFVALAAAVGALAFGANAPALAQDTQTAANPRVVEEVTITAERRPENMQKVPIAVTPISGEQLREHGISSALDLQNNAPSLTVTGDLGERDEDVFTIRGQGAPFGGADPGVQTYFSEVPFGASGVGNYYDMDNVQVLSGPQGTLFGRSTTGGAVLFQPKKPTDQFGGYLDAQAGNYSMYELSGAVNIPVVDDKFDLRVAGDVAKRDGFTKNLSFNQDLDNLDYEAFRASAIIRPFAGFENYTVFDYLRDRNHGAGAQLTSVNTGTIDNLANEFLGPGFCILNPLDPTCQALAGFEQLMQFAAASQHALGIRKTTSTIPLFYQRDSWGVTDIATYDINDHMRIRNIFGYRDDKVADGFDFDGSFLPLLDVSSPLAPQSHSYQITDEVQLQGETDNLKWILGFYHEDVHPTGGTEIVRNTLGGAQPVPTILMPSPFFGFGSTEIDEFTNTGTSDAVFGQATYNFSGGAEGLSVTAGGRYTWDHKVATATSCIEIALPLTCTFPLQTGNPLVHKFPNQTADFKSPSWNLSAQYQFTPDTMLYATYRRGYKSGGFNSGAGSATSFGEFKPEFLTDVELGTKNNWTILGVPGRTNFDMYYGWYNDVQKNDLVILEQQTSPTTVLIEPIALTFNAAKATIKGLELESTFIPDDNFQVTVFYSYTDASYSRFVLPEMIFLDLGGGQTILSSADHAGNPFANTPQNKLGLTGRFHVPVDSRWGTPYISASWYYQSRVWFSDLSDIEPHAFQNGYSLVNFRVDWDNALGTPFDASFFMNNAFDQNYKVGANALEHLIGTTASIYGPPRMWGFELRWRFGADAEQ